MQITFDQIDELETQRKLHRIKVETLCDEAQINQSTYQRWRNREYLPRGSTLNAFSLALDRLKKKHPRKRGRA